MAGRNNPVTRRDRMAPFSFRSHRSADLVHKLFSGRTLIFPSLLEQLTNRLGAIIDQRKRPRLWSGQMGFKVQPQTIKNCGHNLRRFDGPLDRITADFVALAHHPATFYAAARKSDRPALWPMIAPARWIDLRG